LKCNGCQDEVEDLEVAGNVPRHCANRLAPQNRAACGRMISFTVVAVEKETRRKQQQQQRQQRRKYCMEKDWLTCGLDRLRRATERGCVCTCRIYMHRAMISRRSTRRGSHQHLMLKSVDKGALSLCVGISDFRRSKQSSCRRDTGENRENQAQHIPGSSYCISGFSMS
jgi:hypothetical protein